MGDRFIIETMSQSTRPSRHDETQSGVERHGMPSGEREAAGAVMLEALRKAGYRLTAARRAVVEAMQSGEHRSAPEIVAEVQRRHPGVGRATVYRTLAILSRLCAVQPSLLRTAQAHYAAADGGHHHHFICNRCHRVIEFGRCDADALALQLERQWGVRVQGHLLEFYGLCPACAGEG
ncbi:Fur family transcriptional regulator [Geochorda subterranea]|uniref:Fur family transcriptional regulator n=1 Tax=Geochorda subterranea TaxID=3109564 RepID=A0ABZ1BT35_9FIRM|nr:Fur family transcriptional regulator [Limnochorda sp. LNt]WRP15987.1 Fur family transcriptional regulator [Limnochorda sp. LNt]